MDNKVLSFRPLIPSDREQFNILLSQLTNIDEPTPHEIKYKDTPFDRLMRSCWANRKEVWIVLLNELIIGTYSIVFEQKGSRKKGVVAHIEDVVVHEDYRSMGFGKQIMDSAIKYAKRRGCYKAILECSRDKVKFYEKCGMQEDGVCMRIDI